MSYVVLVVIIFPSGLLSVSGILPGINSQQGTCNMTRDFMDYLWPLILTLNKGITSNRGPITNVSMCLR
jgi:hypothetical protein